VARRCVWSRNLENVEAKARYRAVKIQPQWVVKPRKQTNQPTVYITYVLSSLFSNCWSTEITPLAMNATVCWCIMLLAVNRDADNGSDRWRHRISSEFKTECDNSSHITANWRQAVADSCLFRLNFAKSELLEEQYEPWTPEQTNRTKSLRLERSQQDRVVWHIQGLDLSHPQYVQVLCLLQDAGPLAEGNDRNSFQRFFVIMEINSCQHHQWLIYL